MADKRKVGGAIGILVLVAVALVLFAPEIKEVTGYGKATNVLNVEDCPTGTVIKCTNACEIRNALQNVNRPCPKECNNFCLTEDVADKL